MKVFTTHGLLDIEQLDVADIITFGPDSREIATEWKLKDGGELVRRDVWISKLTPLDAEATQAKL